jgi:glycosyltransferase involved in cell wall biosynthesis
VRVAVLMSLGSPWARQTATDLAGLGHEMHVIYLRGDLPGNYLRADDDFQADSIAAFRRQVAGAHGVEARWPGFLRYALAAPHVAKACRECGAQVLITLYGGGFAVAAYLSRVRPYAVFVVGTDVLVAGQVKRWTMRRVLGRAGLVLANGNHLAERTQHLAPMARVLPLYLGVDTERYTLGMPPGSPLRIVCTRGFNPVYNNEYLVHALARLPHNLPDFEVVFVSGGPLLNDVRTLAATLLPGPIWERVRFLGGVTEEVLLSILRGSHIYVSLSRSDGTSISLLEALACGVFPVVTDIPANREWVDARRGNGILVPLDQPERLAGALAHALSDGRIREQARHVNRALVEERARSRRNVRVLAGHLEELIEVRS